MMVLVVLQMLKTFNTVHNLEYASGQMMGPVVLKLLKTSTTVHTLLYGVGWQVMGPVVTAQGLKTLTAN